MTHVSNTAYVCCIQILRDHRGWDRLQASPDTVTRFSSNNTHKRPNHRFESDSEDEVPAKLTKTLPPAPTIKGPGFEVRPTLKRLALSPEIPNQMTRQFVRSPEPRPSMRSPEPRPSMRTPEPRPSMRSPEVQPQDYHWRHFGTTNSNGLAFKWYIKIIYIYIYVYLHSKCFSLYTLKTSAKCAGFSAALNLGFEEHFTIALTSFPVCLFAPLLAWEKSEYMFVSQFFLFGHGTTVI